MSQREALRQLSQNLGSNPALVQAAGGNTSLKENGVMWIKASGTWLSQAMERDIFIPLDIAKLITALKANDPACETCQTFVRTDLTSSTLRPSIETSVHGLMPQNVVLHVHCVETLAIAIQRNARAKLDALLKNFNWAFVPYARPGLPLSAAIQSVHTPGIDVLILANHGLVVAAETVELAHELLRAVTTALAQPIHRFTRPNLPRLRSISEHTDYRLPTDSKCHDFALERWSCIAASQQVFYPDHAVFLGPSIANYFGAKSPAIAMRGSGVLVHKNAGPAVEPMLRCLSDVFRRLTAKSELRALTEQDIMALMNWDAETYRQSLKHT